MLDSENGQVRFSLRVTTRGVALLFAAAIAAFSALECGSEEYSIAAYYPVPYGSFQRLQVTKQFVVVTGSNTGPRITLDWPINTRVVMDSNATIPGYFNQGFVFNNESTSVPFSIMAEGNLFMSPTNSSTADSMITLYSDTGHFKYTRLQNFCYWFAATSPSQGCYAITGVASSVWNVMSITATAGTCDGRTISHAGAGSVYCTLCCKLTMI